MSARKKHSNMEIEAAIISAENLGWRYKRAGNSAHAWGRLLCPLQTKEGCMMSIWSTPRNSEIHAKQINKRIKKCPHSQHEQQHDKIK